jgi:DNA topoisomerase-1
MGPAKSKREAEKNIVAAVDMTAKRLGNTRSVCRKYYIHPVLIEAYLEGSVLPPLPERTWSKRKSKGPTLRQHEMDVLAFLKARIKPKTKPRRSAAERRPKRVDAEDRGPERVEIVPNVPAEPVQEISEEPTESDAGATETSGELKPTGS